MAERADTQAITCATCDGLGVVPGGERAQDEPQARDRADLLRDAIGTMLIANAVAPSAVHNLGRFAIDRDNGILTTSPRPAEPEPPKAEQEPCRVPPTGWYCTRGAGHDGPCAARSTDGNEQAWEDLAADGGLPESQPKADTGTLEALEQAAADAELYGHLYARDALRDALTELRRLRAEIAINKHARALSLLGRSSEQEAREEGLREKLAEAEIRAEQAEARASSPDLRGLVADAKAFIEAAEEYRCASYVNMAKDDEATAIEVRMLEARNVLRDRLEATLTGTGD